MFFAFFNFSVVGGLRWWVAALSYPPGVPGGPLSL
nr:MAG TPA: hypothetical protein [Caudoviricetes sp.]